MNHFAGIPVHRLLAGLCVMLTGGIVGCGSSDSAPPLIPVTGTVMQDGKPLEGARVEFYPEKGRRSIGSVDKEGRFALEYGLNEPGAIAGPGQFQFFVPKPLTPKQEAEMAKLGDWDRKEYLKRAGDPVKLKYEESGTVQKGKTFTFDLTGKS